MSFIRADIIAALATAPLPAGVAVVRLSGKGALALAQRLCPAFVDVPPRTMQHVQLTHNGTLLDEGLLVWFKAPHSFTGEEVVEFHGHGGRAVVKAVLDGFYAEGAKPAQAGEFSRRAFLNGKLDLTQAEAMADLIAANTEAQHQQALVQMQGELGSRFEAWRGDVLHLVAHAEAAIDFPDEELDVLAQSGLKSKLEILIQTLEQAAANKAGQRLREGFTVAVLGQPNRGKSTLTNLLTGKETAIVSPIAGTTRDVLESHLNVAGYPVILADTAGLRSTEDTIEAEGVQRAEQKAANADIVIVVTDVNDWPIQITDMDAPLNLDSLRWLKGKPGFVVVSKIDQATGAHKEQQKEGLGQDGQSQAKNTSAPNNLPDNLTGQIAGQIAGQVAGQVAGQLTVENHVYPVLKLNLTDSTTLQPLLTCLQTTIEQHMGQAAEGAQINRERHKQAVQEALGYLRQAATLLETPDLFSSDMLAQDLRDAANAIGSVTGRTDTESVLDVVFSTFCVGK